MPLVVFEPLAALGDRRNVPRRDPPETIVGLVHLLKPLGAVAKDAGVVGFAGEEAKRLDRLPNGHVDDDEGIVAVGHVRSVARCRLQPPQETR